MSGVRRYQEKIRGLEVEIEVWPRDGRYSGYAFCPTRECRDKCKEALKAEFRYTPARAMSDAKNALSKHLKNVHSL